MPNRPQNATDPNSIPEQFGPYRILQRLGQGGMGTVYLALDNRLNRKVALKVCHHAGNGQAMERFRREAMAAASLRHANLCPVFDCDVVDGTAYFTMAFIEGPTLDQWVAQRNGLGQRDAALLVRKLALALHYAHERGVVHRDLKPTNIAMDKNEPIVLDFGLAQYQEPSGNNKLTRMGTMLGTPSYMAPEQVAGDVAAMGPCSDVYSLGVILYELLTRQVPFKGSVTEVMAKILSTLPQPPRSVRADVDLKLEAICLKALAKKPAERWSDMQGFATALTAWAKAMPANTMPGRRPGSVSQKEFVDTSIANSDFPPTFRTTNGPPPLVSPTLVPIVELLPSTDLAFPPLLPASNEGAVIAPLVFANKKKALSRRPSFLNGSRKVIGLVLGLALLGAGIVAVSMRVFRHAPAKVPDPEIAPSLGKKFTNIAPSLGKKFTNSLGMEFVLVGKGTARMGGGNGQPGEKKVEIPEDFYLGKYEVTQEEWQKVTGLEPSVFARNGLGKDAVKDIPDAELKRFPVEQVSWDDAQMFLDLLNEREKEVGWIYRLPKEAESEYACRDGPLSGKVGSAWNFYFDKPANKLLPNQANFSHESSPKRTCKVGSYPPNRLGLYDMHGNVWEWCDDSEGDSLRVNRSGGWNVGSDNCRAAFRNGILRSSRVSALGLRVARIRVGK